MRIVDVREITQPISSPIRNAYIDFTKMTTSLVAVVTDVVRDGRPVVGYSVAGIGELVDEGLVHGVTPGTSPAVVAEQLVTVMSSPLPTAIPELPTWDTATAQLARLYLAAAGRPANATTEVIR